MSTLEISIVALYFFVLFLLTLYGAHRYVLTYLFYRYRKPVKSKRVFSDLELPEVTVQLPIFNERYVLRRLLEAVCSIDYPKDRLEIQILDDSTDETKEIAANLAEEYRQKGFDVVHIHRTNREGYKAGALENGMKVARGKFFAIFDADFIPPKNFLRETIHYFSDPEVGMVQVRWEHINRDYSLLTRAQALFLDGHFAIEHAARFFSGRFFNFNGTAGIWRKECIEDAGGWQHDTITEDLDLSYRAQLKGWKFIYINDLAAPAELPVEMNAFRSQQHRWSKGSIETAIKLLPTLIKSPIPFKTKMEAIYHLTGNISYLLLVMLAILMPSAILIRLKNGWDGTLGIDLIFLIAGTLPLLLFYSCAQKEINAPWLSRIAYFPFALMLGAGMSLNNCKAVIEALLGYKTEFTRTPKYNIKDKRDNWKSRRYRGMKTLLPLFELAIGGYLTYVIIYVISKQAYLALPFLVLFQLGFLYVAISSLFQQLAVKLNDFLENIRKRIEGTAQ